MNRLPIQRPDYRNNGRYQFVRSYTHSGAEACDHISPDEIRRQMTDKFGVGMLVDDGLDLWWESELLPDGYWRQLESGII